MSDEVLDAIIFMQQYYKNNESINKGSEATKTPKIQNTSGTTRSQSRMNQTAIITTPEISKNDLNTTVSEDPAVMKRGRIEHGSEKGGKNLGQT